MAFELSPFLDFQKLYVHPCKCAGRNCCSYLGLHFFILMLFYMCIYAAMILGSCVTGLPDAQVVFLLSMRGGEMRRIVFAWRASGECSVRRMSA